VRRARISAPSYNSEISLEEQLGIAKTKPRQVFSGRRETGGEDKRKDPERGDIRKELPREAVVERKAETSRVHATHGAQVGPRRVEGKPKGSYAQKKFTVGEAQTSPEEFQKDAGTQFEKSTRNLGIQFDSGVISQEDRRVRCVQTDAHMSLIHKDTQTEDQINPTLFEERGNNPDHLEGTASSASQSNDPLPDQLLSLMTLFSGDGKAATMVFDKKKVFLKIQNGSMAMKVGGGYMLVDDFLYRKANALDLAETRAAENEGTAPSSGAGAAAAVKAAIRIRRMSTMAKLESKSLKTSEHASIPDKSGGIPHLKTPESSVSGPDERQESE